ncbi:MAG: YqgE/AlgH family protein [Actinomycetota bacterium]
MADLGPELPPWVGLRPAAGRLLVSAPLLTGPAFFRTVVYLLEHRDDDDTAGGTVGVILNRPSRTPVGQVLPDWQDVMSAPSVVFSGGPVLPDGALCLGHALSEATGLRFVCDGVATVDLDAEVALIQGVTDQLRVFAGHSGWSPGQLADELAAGAWYVVDGSTRDVFSDDPAPLWQRVLRRQPPPLSLLSTYPVDPLVN